MELSVDQGKKLVRMAREVIEDFLSKKEVKPRVEEWMREKRGVFVTLKKWPSGELRGCIGHPYPDEPLVDAIVDSAKSAAVADPRFPSVRKEEMDSIVVEVSVLTEPEEIRVDAKNYKKMIKCGRDGLIVKRGFAAGLLLPQVADEFGWDEKEFLAQTCWKAGLPPDCWLDKETHIYRFQAQVFSEEKPRGEVKADEGSEI